MKISSRTELMFSQAVALAEAGRMKSTIHAYGNEIFILNMDDTIILRFKSDDSFPERVSFNADEYESPNLTIKEGRIVFASSEGGYSRTKSCAAPKTDYNQVKIYWDKFTVDLKSPISFNKGVTSLLEDNLSHIEIETYPKVKLIQKNIYTGERVEVKKSDSMDLLGEEEYEGFPIIGLRTTDFKALFSLVNEITLYLQPDENWLYFKEHSGILQGVISTCTYDELGYVKEIDHGRKK